MRMLASIRDNQWLMLDTAIQGFALAALDVAEKSEAERSDSYWEDFYTLRTDANIDGDGIAHVEIRGALLYKSPTIYEKLGLTTRYSTIEAETAWAKSQGALGILYHNESPGGTVAGVIEGSAAIADAGIPTVTHSSGLTCSAAYWLASSTDAIISTPSAEMGNIGAIISWADCTKFWEGMGVEFKALVSEGADLKSTFHLEPDEAQTAFLQESINSAGEQFRNHVSAGREAAGADLNPEVWRAGWYHGEKAGDLGLIDGVGSESDAKSVLMSLIQAV